MLVGGRLGTTDEVEGEKHSRRQRRLWSLGENAETNLGCTGVQQCTLGSLGGTPSCWGWGGGAASVVGGLQRIVLTCWR